MPATAKRKPTAVDEIGEPFFNDPRTLAEKLSGEELAWMPHKEDDSPRTISGLVLERTTTPSDYKDELAPMLLVLDARSNTIWRIKGYQGFLRTEIERQRPEVGDFVAIRYEGLGQSKQEGRNAPHIFKMAVERNPDRPATEQSPREPFIAPEAAASAAEPSASEGGDDIPF